MYRHPFRKSFGLIVLYSIIIIGIFVLQFRNESVVSKTIGLLSISFAQSQSESGEISLKNSLQVSFKGISFTADEVNPAKILIQTEEGTKTQTLSLVSAEQTTPLSYTFGFSENVSLTFAVSGTDSDAALSITASLPEYAQNLSLNYKPTSGFSVTEKTKSRLVLNSKNLTYAFTASQIDEKSILFTLQNLVSYYVAYNPSVEFSFASLDSDLIIAQKATYDTNIKTLRENLVSSVADSIKNNQNLSEKAVIAYVAELASQGRYSEAVNYVPDSFKKGNKRTYLSAPFFNSLDAMYPSLEMHNENLAEMIQNAIDSATLSVFTVEDLADYLDTLPDSPIVRNLLSIPTKILESDSASEQVKLSQASGILRTYLKLASIHSVYADSLYSAAQECLSIIEASCVLSDSTLSLLEKDVPVSHFLALSTGNALVLWGEFNNSEQHSQTGYALINSILATNSLDAITLADIYPILVNNAYYPHYKLLSRNAAGTIWAWTCAPSVFYSLQGNIGNLSVTFTKGETNYAIVCGIPAFTEIEIYGLSFHSDPRFESYNSSGFIYRSAKKALLLKSRHKTETEVVRLSY